LGGSDSSINAPSPKKGERSSVVCSQEKAGDAPRWSRNPQLAEAANADA
jgi:hypothetical protein